MLTRLRKQMIYGLFYAVVVVGGTLLIANLINGPIQAPAATPSPSATANPIQLEGVDTIVHPDPTLPGAISVDIAVRLRNTSLSAGVPAYAFTVQFLSADGRLIQEQSVEAYILPGTLQYIPLLGVRLREALGSVEVKLPEQPEFMALPPSVELPRFSSFLRERTTREQGQRVLEEQVGIVKNTGTFDWQKVEVVGLAFNRAKKLVGVGKTFVGELKRGESREFNLTWPAPSDATDQVVILPSTNIFREDNLIRAIGDPGQLR